MTDDPSTVKVTKDDRGALIVQGTTYRDNGGHMILAAQHLRVCTQGDSTWIAGAATPEDRVRLGVIGTDDYCSAEVMLNLRRDAGESEKWPELYGSPVAGMAFIALFTADWETNTREHWAIQITVRTAHFDAVVDQLRAGRLSSLTAQIITEKGLYTDAPMAPSNFPHIWRLAPDDKGRVDRPNPAWAPVNFVRVEEKTRQLVPEDDAPQPAADPEHPAPSPSLPDSALAREQIAALRSIRRGLLWLSAALILAALITRIH